MIARNLACLLLAILFQSASHAQTATATMQGSSPALDAARGSAGNTDDPMRRPGISIGGKPGGGMFNIQGGGIGLPPGVGNEKRDEEKPKVAQPACTGVDAQGRACGEQASSDSVGQRIEQGTEKNPGAARPTSITIQGPGIGTPTCFGDSRDSGACK